MPLCCDDLRFSGTHGLEMHSSCIEMLDQMALVVMNISICFAIHTYLPHARSL